MKYLFVMPVFLLLCLMSHAQIKMKAQSPFLENDKRTTIQRVLLMKNGCTFYLGINKKEMTVNIYSPKFKLSSSKQLPPPVGKESAFKVKGLYDMNGDITALVSTILEHQVVLKRLVFDGKNGALKEDSVISQLEKVSYFKHMGVAVGVPEPDFFSQAMPEGNGYAVVSVNSFHADRNKRIAVSIYGADNKELSHAFYQSPEEKYKYMEFLGLAPFEKDKLGILAYGYNTAASGGKECELIFGQLIAGDTVLTMDKLGTTRKPANASIAKYNPASKKLMLLTMDTREGYSTTVVDPIGRIAKSNLLAKYKGSGAPQDLFANEDGTFTAVFESITITNVNTLYKFEMKDYDVNVLSEKDMEIVQHYRIPRFQRRDNTLRSIFFQNANEYFELAYKQPSAMDAFNYLSANGKNYLFLNDNPDNVERGQTGEKLREIKSLEKNDAFYYKLSGTKEVPAVDYLFDKPAENGDHNRGVFKAFDYSADKQLYVVVKAEEQGKHTGSRLVWMKL